MAENQNDAKPAETFERSLDELETVVRELEGGDLPLERSLELFERGTGLSDSCRLAEEATAAGTRADFEQAKLKAEVNDQLYKDGLVSALDLRLSKVTAEQANTKNTIEQKRYTFTKDSSAPQLSVKQAEVERLD